MRPNLVKRGELLLEGRKNVLQVPVTGGCR